jgi:hypothetical protein
MEMLILSSDKEYITVLVNKIYKIKLPKIIFCDLLTSAGKKFQLEDLDKEKNVIAKEDKIFNEVLKKDIERIFEKLKEGELP